MKAYINHHLFTEQPLDSAKLTMATSVIHNFSEPGTYFGSIRAAEKTRSNFHLLVDEKYPAMQVTIDLADSGKTAAADCDCKTEKEDGRHYEVNPKGFVVFYVSGGAGGYAIHVTGKVTRSSEPVVFDSKDLYAGDIFAVSLLRPGTHIVSNNMGTKAQITVQYPGGKNGRERYNRAPPVNIRCTESGFNPSEVVVEAAQGLVFRIETKSASRIRTELSRADDGGKEKAPSRVFSWRKPPAREESPAREEPPKVTPKKSK